MQLVLMIGLPGSGKTTWAKNWVMEKPHSRIRVSRNTIRSMLGPNTLITNQREALISVIESTTVRDALKRGYDVVIDAHHLNPKVIKKWKNYVDMINDSPKINDVLTLKYMHMNTPIDVCISRDKSRNGDESVGKEVILKLYEKYLKVNEDQPGKGNTKFVIKLDKDYFPDIFNGDDTSTNNTAQSPLEPSKDDMEW